MTSVVLTGVLTCAEMLSSDAETLTSDSATLAPTVGCEGSGFPDGAGDGSGCVTDGACGESGGVTDGVCGEFGRALPGGVPPPGSSG